LSTYIVGAQVPKNESKAFQYFLLAAEYENDGDALFNTAFCLENGIGVTANLSRAISYYSLGAQKTGHFGCIKTMGMYALEV
jgi:TPR repeat protein